jgi:rare lipoprotein A (peptidoglycan hydrolase)
MKSKTNRPWRKDHSRAASILVVTALLAFGAAPAQAATGGAAAPISGEVTSDAGAFSPLRWAGATWYGPGLYGNSTACGQVLRPSTLGVAHRSLPCGTAVKFVYRGRQVITRVIDRGPYSYGNDWDLTLAAAEALGFDQVGADLVGFAVSRDYAGSSRAKRRSRR